MATANGLPVSGIECVAVPDGCVYGGPPGHVELVHCSATPTTSTSASGDERMAICLQTSTGDVTQHAPGRACRKRGPKVRPPRAARRARWVVARPAFNARSLPSQL